MSFITNILSRLLLAIIPSFLYTFFSYIILYFLYKFKNKELPEPYLDMVSYIFLTNYIIICLILIFFIKGNISLF